MHNAMLYVQFHDLNAQYFIIPFVSQDFVKEALTWNDLKHPRIVPFLGVEITLFNPRISLVSKWMPNDNISKYLHNNSIAEPLVLVCPF